ncbi:general secretion pathway protein GspB [Ferrimonas pelagia]|uniref:Type II secretion system protein GspB C-terminal domain-containing protein n=1 Tax=Ferrimonas pelagia TaxID=1177826 RepID=A0ABP9FKB5_9GAMM
MSLLLDAVSRHRHDQAQQGGVDPALLAALPVNKPMRRFRGIWISPLLALMVGGALGWVSWPSASPASQVAPPAAVSLAGRIALPLPVDLQAASASPASVEVAPAPALAADAAGAVTSPEVAASTAVTRPSVEAEAPTEPETSPALQRAFEAALADLNIEPEAPVEPEVPQSALQQALAAALAQSELAEAETTPTAAQSEPESEPVPALSFELQQKLLQAQRDVAAAQRQPAQPAERTVEPTAIPKLGQMPWAFQKRLPDLDVTAHVYATRPEDRWLRANGRELQEGDEAAPGLIVTEILPSEIVLEMDEQKFRIPALGSI